MYDVESKKLAKKKREKVSSLPSIIPDIVVETV
jgi:hypothetical protein